MISPHEHMTRLDEAGTAYTLVVTRRGVERAEFDVLNHGPDWVHVRQIGPKKGLVRWYLWSQLSPISIREV